MDNFTETLYDSYRQQLAVDRVLLETRSEHQHLIIFENALFGRVLALDGVVQTTERDEFIYHEMLTHVPLLAHGHARRVLIVGGGDGGILREVVRHGGVERIVQVEIDRAVVDMCRQYLPHHSNGAFDDPRLELVIDDGLAFVNRTDEQFDVIISDSTDPIGPGEVLFSRDFYAACRARLAAKGVLVTQNGVAFMQTPEVATTAERLGPLFGDWHFYAAAVPTYVGGIMTFAWASDDPTLRQVAPGTLAERYQRADLTTRYYTPDIHGASFALPRYVLDAIGK
ncbi:MAG: polyamine aminopropyltransferase [Candidatus Competibacterales bacterium]